MACAKQVFGCACLEQQTIITILVAMICVQSLTVAETSCENCTTVVHRYVYASGNNYVSFEPCLSDMSCQDHCSARDQYQITSVAVDNSNNEQKVKAYWNNEQVFLEIHSFLTLEPFNIVTEITYICHKHPPTLGHNVRNVTVTVRLKPIRIELQMNASHDAEHAGQSEELLDCVINGHFDSEKAKTRIHYVHQENATTVTTDMNCTYDHYHTQNESSSTTTRCAKSVSHLESGQYYCTVDIGERFFTSNVKDISSTESGPSQQDAIAKVTGGVGGALLLVLLVSVMINFYSCFQRRQQVDDERQQLIQGNPVQRHYQAVEDGLVGNGGGSRAHSVHSEGSQRSGGSSPNGNVHLSQQQGNGEDSEV